MEAYRKPHIIFLSCSIGLLLAPIWLIVSDWRSFKGTYLVDRSKFVSTEGEIISSTTYTTTSRKRNRVYYHYAISYRYSINGRTYQSKGITFRPDYDARPQIAEYYVSKYPVGSRVTVYYDPADPTFSVLELDMISHNGKLGFLLVSLVIFLIALVNWWLRRTRPG